MNDDVSDRLMGIAIRIGTATQMAKDIQDNIGAIIDLAWDLEEEQRDRVIAFLVSITMFSENIMGAAQMQSELIQELLGEEE